MISGAERMSDTTLVDSPKKMDQIDSAAWIKGLSPWLAIGLPWLTPELTLFYLQDMH